MAIATSEEARTLACELTSRRRSPAELARSLDYFRGNLTRAADEQSRVTWRAQIDSLEAWLASEAYKSGDYSEGIDALMLELTDWRAMIYAFENVDTEKTPFSTYTFFSRWRVGAVYAIFSLMGKLNSKDKRDNSLRNLWSSVAGFIASDGACTSEEFADIEQRLHPLLGQFTNAQSRAMKFRNTVIAHNEKSLEITWEELDADIQTFVRIWSLIVSWSSFGVLDPYASADDAFAGLACFFTDSELRSLKAKRKDYLDRIRAWSHTYLHNGEVDPGRGPFATISVTSLALGE